jgi:hypothetical protein
VNEEVLELLREMDRKISALQTDVFSLEEKLDQLLSTEIYIRLKRQE